LNAFARIPNRGGGPPGNRDLPSRGRSGTDVSRNLPLRILLAAPEVVGFAKTGGLADVAGALPAALARRGLDCSVILPLYRSCRGAALEPTDLTLRVPVGGRIVSGRLWRSALPNSNVPVWLIEQPDYYERDDPATGRGLYQYTLPTGARRDYPDNCERFVFFCRATVEALRLLDYWPNVLHSNDWQTGLIPVYLREHYDRLSDHRLHLQYKSVRTLYTVHNIAYQGVFWHWDFPLTGLDWRLFNPQQLEFYGHLNFLKAGLVYADFINTVSPTYAREIQTPYYGSGLQGVLAERRDRLSGIVNGVDYRIWDPAQDTHLPAHYSADALEPGKPLCKADLQRRQGLAIEPHSPLLAVVARLVEQKGLDLLLKAAPDILGRGAQLVVLGEGDPAYHRALEDLQSRFPKRMRLNVGFDEDLAHRIEAGADVFLMPSLYEPSGLNQLYSMRYGTPPVVRATGGLADTVTDTTPKTLADGTATGFRFAACNGEALRETVERALQCYRDRPEDWRQVMVNGMRQDWSWDRSAEAYEKLYRAAASRRVASKQVAE
jgi:starch synthase